MNGIAEKVLKNYSRLIKFYLIWSLNFSIFVLIFLIESIIRPF